MVWLVTGDRADRVDVRAAVHRAGMPDGLASALLTSLAIDPSDRHADVGHWLADVTEAIAPTLPERMLRAAMRRGSRTARPRRRRRSVVGAIALIVIGALAGVAGAAWLGDSGDAQRVEDVGGGRVRVVDTAGAATLSITGPAEVPVGRVIATHVQPNAPPIRPTTIEHVVRPQEKTLMSRDHIHARQMLAVLAALGLVAAACSSSDDGDGGRARVGPEDGPSAGQRGS